MTKLLGNNSKGILFVVSAPAGTGKTTLVQMLVNEFPCVVESISYTTRDPRPQEINGVHYHFVKPEEFKTMVKAGKFLEYVGLYGNFYGTSRDKVIEELDQGKHVVLVIDTQGGLQLKSKMDACFIFIKPPSFEELKKRLVNRQTEPLAVVEKRLQWAEKEYEDSKYYDYHIINDDLNIAYQVLKSIIIAEEHRQKNQ